MKLRPVKQSLLLREFLALDRRAAEEGVTVGELERWRAMRRAIETQLGVAAGSWTEQRRSVRIPVSLHVAFETHHEFAKTILRNLSRGGFFIETKEPLPIGSVFRAHIEVTEWRLQVTPQVKVVSHHVGPDLAVNALGMGVAFQELSRAERQTIDAVYELCLGAVLERSSRDAR